jgi:ATP-dependent DNA helicase RecG
MLTFRFSNKSKFRVRYINPLIEFGLLELTIMGKPKSHNQKYTTTLEGKISLKSL